MSHGGNIVTVNAFYSPNSNTMIVPIGMLQDPIYWSQPKSLTFGAFWNVVAHEITHAFDDSCINYNSEGMSAQLYDNKTVEAFHKEATCLRDQYSKYSICRLPSGWKLNIWRKLSWPWRTQYGPRRDKKIKITDFQPCPLMTCNYFSSAMHYHGARGTLINIQRTK